MKQIVNLPDGFHLRKEVGVINTYEEFMIVINTATLIAAILTYVNNKDKDTKNNHPADQVVWLFLKR